MKTQSVYGNKSFLLFAFKEEKKTQHLDIIFQSNHWCYTPVKGHIFVLFAEQGPINKNKVDAELLSMKQFLVLVQENIIKEESKMYLPECVFGHRSRCAHGS